MKNPTGRALPVYLALLVILSTGACASAGHKLQTPKDRQVWYDLAAGVSRLGGFNENAPNLGKTVCEMPATTQGLLAPYMGPNIEYTEAMLALDSFDDKSVYKFFLGAVGGVLQALDRCPEKLEYPRDSPKKYVPRYSMERVVLITLMGGGGGLNASHLEDPGLGPTGSPTNEMGGTATGSVSVLYGVIGSFAVGVRADMFFVGNGYTDLGATPTAWMQFQFHKTMYLGLGLGASIIKRSLEMEMGEDIDETDVGFGMTFSWGYRWKIARRFGLTLEAFGTLGPDAVTFGAMLGPTILVN